VLLLCSCSGQSLDWPAQIRERVLTLLVARPIEWYPVCKHIFREKKMKTVAEWLKKHPNVKARMFERNYKKQKWFQET